MTVTKSKLPLGDAKILVAPRLYAGIIGGIPCIGPIIQTVILETIPTVRLDRIEAFILNLESRIKAPALSKALSAPEGCDMFEEGLWQSTRALTTERQSYISGLVIKGLTSSEMKKHKTRHFLRILNQIDDRQIILLTRYLPEKLQKENASQSRPRTESEKEIVNPSLSIVDMFVGEDRDKAEELNQLHASMIGHLTSFGLLEADGSFTNTGQPLTTRKFHINNFGKDFLKYIGVC